MRWIAALCLTFAACDRHPEVPTEAENRDLDEAGRMLDSADNGLETIDAGAIEPAERAENTSRE